MKILRLLLFLFTLSLPSFAQEKKVIIKYQKRQKIDLGALLIDGEVVTPGDFTIDNEKEKASELLYKRKNYNNRLRINIEYVF
ncbi:MAG: hypothetical protein CME65_12490 [Halobacteriovoraceae bacterium]|nr:hypothetical protein [Halobacteriovoraceae bacterium]|tara:strand:- start:2635 stop:2883 length:249 start_codon:yes stop_codon:yes gene_type:complete